LPAALGIVAQTTAANQEPGATQPEIRINIGSSPGERDAGTRRLHGPTGERWTFNASGPVTNPAARLSAQARGGQALQAEEPARRQHGRFRCTAWGRLRSRIRHLRWSPGRHGKL
jgi:hypothetical protein